MWTEWRVYQCVVCCSCGVDRVEVVSVFCSCGVDRVEGVSVCCLL